MARKPAWCCPTFKAALGLDCEVHEPQGCPDAVIVKVRRGYGLSIKDGGSSYLRIRFCLFCGKELPPYRKR